MNRTEREKNWQLAVELEKKNQRRKVKANCIATMLFIFGVVFLFISGTKVWITVDNCRCYYYHDHYYFSIIVTIIISLCSFIYYKVIKKNFAGALIVILPTVFFTFQYKLEPSIIEARINDNISVVKQGIIIDKYQPKFGGVITISFKTGAKNGKWAFSTRDFPIEKLSIGDTILFVRVEKCKYIAKIYKFKPTKAELEKCKNDCYLINGQLVDSIPE